MEIIRDWGELILLIVLLLISSGRWTQKQESTPASLARDLDELSKRFAESSKQFRDFRHRHSNWLQSLPQHLDQVYTRKETHNLQYEELIRRLEQLEGEMK